MPPRIAIFITIAFALENPQKSAEHQHEPTLRDLIRFGENFPLFDTLSAAVKAQYSGQDIGNDFVDPHEPFLENKFSLRNLNSNYSDYLLESDIRPNRQLIEEMLEEAMGESGRKKRQAFRNRWYPHTIWKAGVPFAYHRSMNSRKRRAVLTSINFYRRETCIKFYKKTKWDEVYLYFVGHDYGCWSTVGRDPAQGQQWLSIGDGCEPFGISSHEVAHALGVFHEQSRYDRDADVNVLVNRVPNGLFRNFAKVPRKTLKTYGKPYEIGSVMHYGPFEFSKNPNVPSVVARNPNFQYTMGSLTGPTFLDVQLLNTHYNCHAQCKKKIWCQNGGYQNPNKCGMCKCPTGFGGPRCGHMERTNVRGCRGTVKVKYTRRKLRLRLKKVPGVKYQRKCVYHLLAPPGQRIAITVKRLQNTLCESGCWRKAIEFKAQSDKRLTGYRFCCSKYARRKIVSAGRRVPVFLFAGGGEVSAEFSYQIYRKGQSRGNGTETREEVPVPGEVATKTEGEEEEEDDGVEQNVSHDDSLMDDSEGDEDALVEAVPEGEKDPSFYVSHSKKESDSFAAEMMVTSTRLSTAEAEREEQEEVEVEEEETAADLGTTIEDPDIYANPFDVPTEREIQASHAFDVPIDLEKFSQSGLDNFRPPPFVERLEGEEGLKH